MGRDPYRLPEPGRRLGARSVTMSQWRQMSQHRGTLLLAGGRVHVMDGRSRPQDALVVQDGRVLATGAADEMRALAGPRAHRIDVQGATVMPGLVDTHPHMLHFAARLAALVDLTDARDHTDI